MRHFPALTGSMLLFMVLQKYADSYAGETIQEELIALDSIISDTQKPIACLIGGSKISTKIDLITNLLPKVNFMVIGGAMANNFLQYKKYKVGKSKIEDHIDTTVENIINEAIKNKCELILPTDVVTAKNFWR